MNQSLGKDPTLTGAFDNLTALRLGAGGVPEGVAADTAIEAAKQGAIELFGKTAGEVTFGVLDFYKLGASAYEGMNRLEAYRAMLRDVEAQILQLELPHNEQVGYVRDAQDAAAYCQQRVAERRPPIDDPVRRRVLDYINR